MNYKINPTPRDFNSKNDESLFPGKPRLTNKGDKLAFKVNGNEVLWEVVSFDKNTGKITLRNGNKTEVYNAADSGIKWDDVKVFNGNNNNSSSAPKSDYDILLKYGNEEQTKPYLEAIAAKGVADANKIAKTAEYETWKLQREMDRADRRAELPGKIKKTAGEWVDAAAVYGHEHDTIMKAAKQIENEAPRFGDAKWVEDNRKKAKTHSQILKEAENQVDAATSLYKQQSKTYNDYLELKNKAEAGDPEEKEAAINRLNELYGVKDDKGEFKVDKKTGEFIREGLPKPPKSNSNVVYDPSAAFKDNKVAGAVGYTTGLLKAAPAALDDAREFFKPGDVTYFANKANRKLVQRYAKRYQKYENKYKDKVATYKRDKDSEIKNADSLVKSAKLALDEHKTKAETTAKEVEAQHKQTISDIQNEYANNDKVRDKKIEKQNKSYENQKKNLDSQNKEFKSELESNIEAAKSNLKETKKSARGTYEAKSSKAQDKFERKTEKLDKKYLAKMGEARFKDKEIENQMAFDKLKGSVQTTSDVAKAGLALVSKKARRKQIEEEGVDAVNARNARIAYALGDRSFQTRFAAGKVSPLNSLLHPIQSYKRHQINSNIKANRKAFGFSENPEITEYYSGEGWQERESEAIARLLDIDYSKLEEQQDFAELRPSQNYSPSLIGTEKLIDNNNNSNSSPAQTINSVVESTSIPNHLKETDVTKLNEVLEKSYYSPSPAEKFLQEKLSRGFSENEKIDTEYENMLEDIYQRASSSRIV